jgi:hypothetical protein
MEPAGVSIECVDNSPIAGRGDAHADQRVSQLSSMEPGICIPFIIGMRGAKHRRHTMN